MKKFVDAVAGDGKNVTPARKNTAYALLITAIAFALALIILIVSSVVFAVTDKGTGDAADGAAADNGGDGGGAVISSSSLQYETVSIDALEDKVDGMVLLMDKRTTDEGVELYYGISPKNSLKLTESTAEALNLMLVDFYKANSKSLVVSTSDEKKCDLPLVTDAGSDGTSFNIERYEGNDTTIVGESKYEWIFNNAYKYGFINSENTFTYVGAPITMQMKTKSIATVDALIKALGGKAVAVSVPSASGTGKATTYQIYYLEKDAAEIKVPTNYEYSVIANGTDGYFITVDMSKKVQATNNTDGGVG